MMRVLRRGGERVVGIASYPSILVGVCLQVNRQGDIGCVGLSQDSITNAFLFLLELLRKSETPPYLLLSIISCEVADGPRLPVSHAVVGCVVAVIGHSVHHLISLGLATMHDNNHNLQEVGEEQAYDQENVGVPAPELQVDVVVERSEQDLVVDHQGEEALVHFFDAAPLAVDLRFQVEVQGGEHQSHHCKGLELEVGQAEEQDGNEAEEPPPQEHGGVQPEASGLPVVAEPPQVISQDLELLFEIFRVERGLVTREYREQHNRDERGPKENDDARD